MTCACCTPSADSAATAPRLDFRTCIPDDLPQGQMKVIRGARVVSMDPQLGDFVTADILIRDNVIVEIAPDIETDATPIEAGNCIAMPGFVDTHRHCWQTILRHFAPNASVSEYGRDINRIGVHFTPDDVYAGTLLACLNAIDSGVTTLLNWSHISITPEHTDADVQAMQDARIRGVFALGQARAGSTKSKYPDDLERLRRGTFCSDDSRLTLFLGANLDRFKHWPLAREYGVGITAHILAQWVMPLNDPTIALPADTIDGLIDHVAAQGLLGPDITFIHCAGLSQASWAKMADAGCNVSLASTSMSLFGIGAGTPPIQHALDQGIRPSISLDTEVTLPGDFFSHIRATMMFQRAMAYDQEFAGRAQVPPLLSARDVLEFATIDGARANLLDRVTGSLTPGKRADIVLVRTDQINTMPLNNVIGTLVMGADRSNVDMVMVDGEILKWRGRMVGVCLKSLERKVVAAQERVLAASKFDLALFDKGYGAR